MSEVPNFLWATDLCSVYKLMSEIPLGLDINLRASYLFSFELGTPVPLFYA